MRIGTGLAAALGLWSLAACGAAAQFSEATPKPVAAAHTFKIGALDAIALRDGGIAVANDGTLWPTEDKAAVAAALQAAGVPTDKVQLSINVLLVKLGARIFLFDSGDGPARNGLLPASLAAAGVTPAQITDIVITHGHPDHIGGLVTADGKPAFPNAKVRMTEAEWAWLQSRPWGERVKAVAGQVETFKPGATIAPGITAVEVKGHTPGHTAVLIESNGQRLLDIGDTAHQYVVSLREPEFTIEFDTDAPTSEVSRRALLERAVTEKLQIYAPHFPFPGLGSIRREGDGFAWVPLP